MRSPVTRDKALNDLDEPERLQTGPFDDMAAAYDASFTTTAYGKRLRALVWERLDAAFGTSQHVLEIGCGTGEDAVHLASRGVRVLATDSSMPMLRVAAEKAERAGCAERIVFRCVPMERLGAELSGERFDGVYSNFGAINCAPRLDVVVAEVASLLDPGARLAWVVMGRHVPWEWAWFLARGDRQKAFRRWRKGGVSWKGLQVTYPTPAELERMLIPYFAPLRRRSLGLVLPPSYAAGSLEGSPRLLAALTHVERAAQRWQPLAALADHYILEARRLPAGDG